MKAKSAVVHCWGWRKKNLSVIGVTSFVLYQVLCLLLNSGPLCKYIAGSTSQSSTTKTRREERRQKKQTDRQIDRRV